MPIHQQIWDYFRTRSTARYSGPRNIAAALALFVSSVTLPPAGEGHARPHCFTGGQRAGVYADNGPGGRAASHSGIGGQPSYNDSVQHDDGTCLAGGTLHAYFHTASVSQQGGIARPVQRPLPSLPTWYAHQTRATRVMSARLTSHAQRMKLRTAFVPAREGSGNAFPYGQCTWWAAQRYFQLHRIYVPWMTGSDAWAWTMRAHQFHWHVSRSPSIGAIIDLQPGVEGAYGYGHVAVVEQVLDNGHVLASTMNWGSQPRKVQYVQYTVGPGVTFITQ